MNTIITRMVPQDDDEHRSFDVARAKAMQCVKAFLYIHMYVYNKTLMSVLGCLTIEIQKMKTNQHIWKMAMDGSKTNSQPTVLGFYEPLHHGS